MWTRMYLKELTDDYVIYDHVAERDYDHKGTVKYYLTDDTFDILKLDDEDGFKWYAHKAVYGIREMLKEGSFQDYYEVVCG